VRLLALLASLFSLVAWAQPTVADPPPRDLRPVRSSVIANWFRLPFCDNDALSLELPLRYRVSHRRYRDFDLFSIFETAQSRSSAELTIYIGHAPSERHPERAVRRTDQIGGLTVDWYFWSEQETGKIVYRAESMVDFFPIKSNDPPLTLGKPPAPPTPPPPPPAFVCRDGITAHLIVRGSTREAVQNASRIVATLSPQ
jgi:hypothetical protein